MKAFTHRAFLWDSPFVDRDLAKMAKLLGHADPAPLLITPELDCCWITFARSERRQGSRDRGRV